MKCNCLLRNNIFDQYSYILQVINKTNTDYLTDFSLTKPTKNIIDQDYTMRFAFYKIAIIS